MRVVKKAANPPDARGLLPRFALQKPVIGSTFAEFRLRLRNWCRIEPGLSFTTRFFVEGLT